MDSFNQRVLLSPLFDAGVSNPDIASVALGTLQVPMLSSFWHSVLAT